MRFLQWKQDMKTCSPEQGPMRETPSSTYRWVIVFVLWLVHVLSFMNISSLGTIAPFIKEDLRLSSLQIGFLISALSIGSAVCQMPAGLIVDFAGVRRMLTLAVAAIGLFLSLFSQASSFPVAVAVLLLYGGATGIVGPATSKCVLDWFPAVGRATAMGIKQTGINFGGILAGVFLPILVILLTWRHSLLAVGLVETAMAIPVYWLLRESPVRSEVSTTSIAWEKILRMAMRRDMLILGAMGFCFMGVQFSFSAYLVLFLTEEMKYPVVQAGQYFALSYFVGAVARVLWSLASDYLLAGRRRGTLIVITLILLFSSSALGIISFFPAFSPVLTIAILAFGISGIGWSAIYLTIVGEAVGKDSTGLATGIGFCFGFLGSLTAPPLFGFLVDQTGTHGWSWFFLTSCAAAVMILLYFFREKKGCEPQRTTS